MCSGIALCLTLKYSVVVGCCFSLFELRLNIVLLSFSVFMHVIQGGRPSGKPGKVRDFVIDQVNFFKLGKSGKLFSICSLFN